MMSLAAVHESGNWPKAVIARPSARRTLLRGIYQI
jgi:hypothetical protein